MRLAGSIVVLGALIGCATPAVKPAPTPMAATPGGHGHEKVDPAGAVRVFDHPPKIGEKAICAVSGEAFVVDADTQTTEYQGKYYAFCCPDCPKEFKANPAKFVHPD